MRTLLVLLAWALWPALAAEPNTAAPATRVALYVQFEQAPPEAVTEALRGELDAIMGPIGLRFDWRSLPASNNVEAVARLAVVRVKGTCDAGGQPPHPASTGALGWTHISNGIIIPFADLDCGGLRAFLGEQLAALPLKERDGALGRALGRVLAHELYHIFANTTRHAAEGAGKPAYSVEDLLSNDFRFAKRESLAMRAR